MKIVLQKIHIRYFAQAIKCAILPEKIYAFPATAIITEYVIMNLKNARAAIASIQISHQIARVQPSIASMGYAKMSAEMGYAKMMKAALAALKIA